MTRKDIVKELAELANLNTQQATKALEAIIQITATALENEEPILLRGFGSFKTVKRAAKTARDIHKRKTIMLPPAKQVKFIAYNELKKRVNRHE